MERAAFEELRRRVVLPAWLEDPEVRLSAKDSGFKVQGCIQTHARNKVLGRYTWPPALSFLNPNSSPSGATESRARRSPLFSCVSLVRRLKKYSCEATSFCALHSVQFPPSRPICLMSYPFLPSFPPSRPPEPRFFDPRPRKRRTWTASTPCCPTRTSR